MPGKNRKGLSELYETNFQRDSDPRGRVFVVQCIEVDIASQGETEEEALENLRDALELHFTPPVAAVAPQVRTVEVEVAA
jgi:hypothetical protein